MAPNDSRSMIDMKVALNNQILHCNDEPVKAKDHTKKKKESTTEWNVAMTGNGTFEHWPEHLPKPPSRKNLMQDESSNNAHKRNPNAPNVIVFNANTQEGASMVRVLAEKGMNVTAVVRVFTSKYAKQLIPLSPQVTLKVADLNNYDKLIDAAQGCQQAFLVTKYWERFENVIEEEMARVVLSASANVGITRLILATFEDTTELIARNRKSQIIPTSDGRIFPKFDGMSNIGEMAKSYGIQITHMFTSYLDNGETKKSLILIRGENGRIITQSHVQDSERNKQYM